MKTKSKSGRTSNKRSGKEPIRKLNPFEIHINRSKFQVFGRKSNSDHGLPGISRNKALQKRKKTLLLEYKMKDKNNQFIDQRIGGNNFGITEDDRILKRFTGERMRMFKNKKAMFNLTDSDPLSHEEQTLSEVERFENIMSDEDDDEDDPKRSGILKGKFVANAHFGGGMLKKSKEDRESVIEELINESKKRKAERQRKKEETLEATEQLDEEWKTLGSIITKKAKGEEDAIPEDTQKKDDYDVVMRQLKFEPHAQASQRLKTDEEIVKEDKEQLEKLEKERLRQLREIEANKYGNHRSADDLDDGFSYSMDGIEDDGGLSNQDNDQDDSDSSSESDEHLFNQDNKRDDSKSASESDGGTDSKNDKPVTSRSEKMKEAKAKQSKLENNEVKTNHSADESQSNSEENEHIEQEETETNTAVDCDDSSSDGEECAMDDLTDLMPAISEKSNSNRTSSSITEATINKKTEESKENICTAEIELNLPYVLNIPEDYESFKELLNKYNSEQQNVIFDRFIKNNHPKLEPGNKKKMLRLAEYMSHYVSKEDVTWDTLLVVVPHFSTIKEFNREECLKMLIECISSELDNLNETLMSITDMKFLVFYILLFARPQGMDMLLPINKPALSLACKIISQTDITCARHVKTSLLCCYLLQLDAKSSSIVYTDAITFLNNCVKVYSSKTNCNNGVHNICHKTPKDKKSSKLFPGKANDSMDEGLKLRLTFLEGDERDDESDPVLFCSVVLLADFVKVYRKYPQSKILFKSVQNSISKIKLDIYPPLLKQKIVELQTLLQVLQSTGLPPLVKAAKKPKALRQYEPSFHIVTIGSKSNKGLPTEKVEEQKLLHKYKHEMKGAMRELRRDRVFLTNIKLKEKAKSDEQRMKKVKEIYGAGATQQGELRSLKRKKN